MGTVYRAMHTLLRRPVAIKVINRHPVTDDRRFEREVSLIANLDHPHIVEVFDAGWDGPFAFFVMEMLNGVTLQEKVRTSGPLPLEEAANYILGVADALRYTHKMGIIHRDVKPSNIMCCESGIAKVLDFGIARVVRGDAGDGGGMTVDFNCQTNTSDVLGTFDYMAPEQALNSRHADERSDIYSVGCTLFYALTGQTPFPGGNIVESIIAHREQPPPNVRAIRPEVPADLALLLQRMLAKSPADRPDSMSEVVNDHALLTHGNVYGRRSASIRKLRVPLIEPLFIEPNTTGKEADRLFKENPESVALLLRKPDGSIDMIPRDHFYEKLYGQFGWSLFTNRAIDHLAEEATICDFPIDSEEDVATMIRQIGPKLDLVTRRPIVIRGTDGRLAMLDVVRFLRLALTW